MVSFMLHIYKKAVICSTSFLWAERLFLVMMMVHLMKQSRVSSVNSKGLTAYLCDDLALTVVVLDANVHDQTA